MSPAEIAEALRIAREARERAEKATPGPWGEKCGHIKHYVFSKDEGEDFGFSLQEMHWKDGHEVPAHANATFVAHARSDVPALAALVERMAEDLGAEFARSAKLKEALLGIVRAATNHICAQAGSAEETKTLLRLVDVTTAVASDIIPPKSPEPASPRTG